MFRRLIFIVLIIGAVGFIIYQLLQFGFSIANPKSRRMLDFEALKDKLRDRINELVPLTPNELAILSLIPQLELTLTALPNTKFGVVKSIYGESLLSVAQQIRIVPTKTILTSINSSHFSFDYYERDGKIEIIEQNKTIGYIDQFSAKDVNGNIKATIEYGAGLTGFDVVVGDKTCALLYNKAFGSTKEIQRAFKYVEPMDETEMKWFCALTFHYIVGLDIL